MRPVRVPPSMMAACPARHNGTERCIISRKSSVRGLGMKPSETLRLHRDEILRMAKQAHVQNVRVFGSTVRGEDREGSDLDLLVDATEHTSLFDLGGLLSDLEILLGVRVDIVTSGALAAVPSHRRAMAARIMDQAEAI